MLIVILFNALTTSVIGYKLVRVPRENKELREKLENKGNKSQNKTAIFSPGNFKTSNPCGN